jgi:predicted glycoside hydrolase/deacetylase ChbG (UPF0249 family)
MSAVSRDHLRQEKARPTEERRLVLHADDFGMNDLVNSGIVRAFSHGVLTSTSMLTNAPGCESALELWRELRSRPLQNLSSREARCRLTDAGTPFDLGIHLNLTQGRPLTGNCYPPPLLDSDGRFPGVFGLAARLTRFGRRFTRQIEQELCGQIEILCDAGIVPTHMNSHQYIDIFPVISEMVPRLLQRYGIPVARVPLETDLTRTTLIRRFEPTQWSLAQVKRLFAFRHLRWIRQNGVPYPSHYFGTAHAGRIKLDLMQAFVAAAGRGITEIGMHPGLSGAPGMSTAQTGTADDGWSDPLADLRGAELALLTSPQLVELLEQRQVRLARLSDLVSTRAITAAA